MRSLIQWCTVLLLFLALCASPVRADDDDVDNTQAVWITIAVVGAAVVLILIVVALAYWWNPWPYGDTHLYGHAHDDPGVVVMHSGGRASSSSLLGSGRIGTASFSPA